MEGKRLPHAAAFCLCRDMISTNVSRETLVEIVLSAKNRV